MDWWNNYSTTTLIHISSKKSSHFSQNNQFKQRQDGADNECELVNKPSTSKKSASTSTNSSDL